MKLLFLLVVLFLVSCAHTEQKTILDIQEPVTITWVRMSEYEIQSICETMNGKRNAVACFVLYPKEKKCVIYSPILKHERDNVNLIRLGEETAHCFLGNYH